MSGERRRRGIGACRGWTKTDTCIQATLNSPVEWIGGCLKNGLSPGVARGQMMNGGGQEKSIKFDEDYENVRPSEKDKT